MKRKNGNKKKSLLLLLERVVGMIMRARKLNLISFLHIELEIRENVHEDI